MADIDFNNPQGPTNPNQASLLGPIGQGLGSLSDAITSEAKDSFDSLSLRGFPRSYVLIVL